MLTVSTFVDPIRQLAKSLKSLSPSSSEEKCSTATAEIFACLAAIAANKDTLSQLKLLHSLKLLQLTCEDKALKTALKDLLLLTHKVSNFILIDCRPASKLDEYLLPELRRHVILSMSASSPEGIQKSLNTIRDLSGHQEQRLVDLLHYIEYNDLPFKSLNLTLKEEAFLLQEGDLNLYSLDFSKFSCDALQEFGKCTPRLSRLCISENSLITSAHFISAFCNLQALHIAWCPEIEHVDGFKNLSKLRSLSVALCPKMQVGQLLDGNNSFKKSLQKVDIYMAKLSLENLSLQSHPNLTYLDMNGCSFTTPPEWSLLAACQNLSTIKLANTGAGLPEVLSLACLTQLKALDITGNSRIDTRYLEHLSNLKNLEAVEIDDKFENSATFEWLRAFPLLNSIDYAGALHQEQSKQLLDFPQLTSFALSNSCVQEETLQDLLLLWQSKKLHIEMQYCIFSPLDLASKCPSEWTIQEFA